MLDLCFLRVYPRVKHLLKMDANMSNLSVSKHVNVVKPLLLLTNIRRRWAQTPPPKQPEATQDAYWAQQQKIR